jgi:hypothetical protein
MLPEDLLYGLCSQPTGFLRRGRTLEQLQEPRVVGWRGKLDHLREETVEQIPQPIAQAAFLLEESLR